MKKFFVKNLCFCCSLGKEKKKTNVPLVQPVAIHDIVSANANGNGTADKPTYTNNAYKEDEATIVQTSSCSNSVYFRSRQLSQLSDISEIFRLPLPDERSLGDVVIEEYDEKSRTLHAAESGDLCDHSASSRAGSRASSTETDQLPTSHDLTKRKLATNSHISKAVEQNNSCHSVTSHNQLPEIVTNTQTQVSQDQNQSVKFTADSERDSGCDDNEDNSDNESSPSIAVSFEESENYFQEEEKCKEEQKINTHSNLIQSPLTA